MKKKVISLIVTLALVVTCLPMTISKAAMSTQYHYLYLSDGSHTRYFSQTYAGEQTMDMPAGISYDKSSNTLTMNGFNQPGMTLEGMNIGDDFTINLVGENAIGGISAGNYDYASYFHFTGTGSLNINATSDVDAALKITGYDCNAKIIIDDSVSMHIKSSNGNPAIEVSRSLDQNAIEFKGNQSVELSEASEDIVTKMTSYPYYGFDNTSNNSRTVTGLAVYRNASNNEIGVVEVENNKYNIYDLVALKNGEYMAVPRDEYDEDTWSYKMTVFDAVPDGYASAGKTIIAVTKNMCWDSMYYCDIEGREGTFVYNSQYVIDINNNEVPQVNVYEVEQVDDLGDVLLPVDGMTNLSELPSTVIPKKEKTVYTYRTKASEIDLNGSGVVTPTTTAEITTAEVTTASEQTSGSDVTTAPEQTTNNVVTTASEQTTAKQQETTKASDDEKQPAVPAVSIKKLKAKKKAIKVSWKTNKKVNGYQIQYGTNKKFKKAKLKTINKASKASCTIKKLKSKKKYYVRIRSFVKAGAKKTYSDWSKAKSKVTK